MHEPDASCSTRLPCPRDVRPYLALLLAVIIATSPAAGNASGPIPNAEPASSAEDAAPLDAAADTHRPREFAGFITDAAVARGLWAEVGELHPYDSTFDTLARFAYGWSALEFGAGTAISDSGNFRRLDFWAKYVGWKLGPVDLGAGLQTQVLHGTPDFTPFATANLSLGDWDLRSSLGYEITGDMFYNAACLRPVGDHVDLRAELYGRIGIESESETVQLLPGADLHFDIGSWRFITRMSAGAYLHPVTDFIAGLSFVLTPT
jgi:hypothetical protein